MHPSSKPAEATRAADFKELKVTSTAFNDHEMIPRQYTCDGENYNPPLNIEDIPVKAMSLAIVVDDPDVPGKTWTHWMIWNIPVTHHIKEHHTHGSQGRNDFGHYNYGGPCPPRGTHRYYFKVYALDTVLDLPVSANKDGLAKAMSEHIIAFGELVGLYKH